MNYKFTDMIITLLRKCNRTDHELFNYILHKFTFLNLNRIVAKKSIYPPHYYLKTTPRSLNKYLYVYKIENTG